MTLVLGALTQDYVVQVSDRRVTRLADGVVCEDTRNKATFFCDRLAFAYSGLAELEGYRTDEWIALALRTARSTDEAIVSVRDAATRVFASVALPPEKRRHAIVAVGWVSTDWSPDPVPAHAVISNAMADGRWLSAAADEFTVNPVGLSRGRTHRLVPPIGSSLRVDADELERNVGRCLERQTSPLEVVRLLGEAVRRTAASDPSVGQNLLAVVIPRPTGSSGLQFVTTPVAPSGYDKIDHAMFFNLPAGSDEVSWSMPNITCGGSVMIRSIFGSG